MKRFGMLFLSFLFLSMVFALPGYAAGGKDFPSQGNPPVRVLDDDNEVEFSGYIESKQPNYWVISQRTVYVDAHTEIDESKGPATVGAFVKVKAQRRNGALYAKEIEVKRPSSSPHPTETVEPTETPHPTETVEPTETPHPTETVEPTETPHPTETPSVTTPQSLDFRGVIERQSADRWTVSGVEITVNANTQIDEHAGSATVGAVVETHAVWQNDGRLWAQEIRVSPRENDDSPQHLHAKGIIQSLSATQWTVSGLDFQLDANTLIDERQAQARPGVVAEVDAQRRNDGAWLARSIRVEDDSQTPSQEPIIEFRGPIQSMSPTMWTIAGYQVRIDTSTRIEHPERAAVGALAEVKARHQADGTWLALKIEVKSSSHETHPIAWTGALDWWNAQTWHVGGRTVRVNANTIIVGQPYTGAIVEVTAQIEADGTLTALRLKVRRVETHTTFRGVVQRIDGNVWTIGDHQVQVDRYTVFDERHGPLGIGVYVEVKATLQADGSWLALRIQTED